MSNRSTFSAAIAVAAGFALLAGCGGDQRELSQLDIVAGGKVHRFHVDVADTQEEWAKGLAGRTSLRDDEGLLFDYGEVRTGVIFWMKDTAVSLDILFIDGQGRVSRIERGTVPGSQDLIPAGAPIRAALELKGGTAARLGIEPGALVRHAVFAR